MYNYYARPGDPKWLGPLAVEGEKAGAVTLQDTEDFQLKPGTHRVVVGLFGLTQPPRDAERINHEGPLLPGRRAAALVNLGLDAVRPLTSGVRASPPP